MFVLFFLQPHCISLSECLSCHSINCFDIVIIIIIIIIIIIMYEKRLNPAP